nr:MAG TPA: hypothetical protein [Caudoviricetes sp.]
MHPAVKRGAGNIQKPRCRRCFLHLSQKNSSGYSLSNQRTRLRGFYWLPVLCLRAHNRVAEKGKPSLRSGAAFVQDFIAHLKITSSGRAKTNKATMLGSPPFSRRAG